MQKNKQGASLKLSNNDDIQNYKVKDAEIVPNRFICFIKIKIDIEGKKYKRCYGSGVILGDRWVLTAAHNVRCHKIWMQELKKIKQVAEDKSYVKLAVHQGSNHGEYSIVNMQFSTKKSAICDYALLEIKPKYDENQQFQKFYPPVVVLSNETRSKIKEISVHGYPLMTNLKTHPNNQDQHSISNVDIYGAKGGMKNADDSKLSYYMPTEKGISGGPIFAKLGQQHIVLGIHKGYQSFEGTADIEKEGEGENVGVIADLMQEEVNEWGYIIKKPFIYTQKTLGLRKSEDKIPEMEIFYLADRGLNFQDILVITAYDLSNLKKIILSGNNLQQKGMECLTRRKYPALNSLFLPQNNIKSLETLTEQHWQNISSIYLLVLSVNKISIFPKGLSLLKNLQNLWFSYNRLNELSDNLIQYCINLTKKVNIFLYDNKIKEMLGPNKEKKQTIQKSPAHIIWTRQQKAEEFP